MSKLRKPDLRKTSREKIHEMAERAKSRERIKKLLNEEPFYSCPMGNNEKSIEECKQRVKDGQLCYCKVRCSCRDCQKKKEDEGLLLCGLNELENEGGCALGCSKCSEHDPCY